MRERERERERERDYLWDRDYLCKLFIITYANYLLLKQEIYVGPRWVLVPWSWRVNFTDNEKSVIMRVCWDRNV
jgi:hypothetical protein